MALYTPVIDVKSKGKLRRINLKPEATLAQAASARKLYIDTNVNEERHFFSIKQKG